MIIILMQNYIAMLLFRLVFLFAELKNLFAENVLFTAISFKKWAFVFKDVAICIFRDIQMG
jgi:hypothetical protein